MVCQGFTSRFYTTMSHGDVTARDSAVRRVVFTSDNTTLAAARDSSAGCGDGKERTPPVAHRDVGRLSRLECKR